jgi:hypothetical protein
VRACVRACVRVCDLVKSWLLIMLSSLFSESILNSVFRIMLSTDCSISRLVPVFSINDPFRTQWVISINSAEADAVLVGF